MGQVVFNGDFQLDSVLLSPAAKRKNQGTDCRIRQGKQFVHPCGIFGQVLQVAFTFPIVSPAEQTAEGLDMEVVVVALGADGAHIGGHFAAVLLFRRKELLLFLVGEDQVDEIQPADLPKTDRNQHPYRLQPDHPRQGAGQAVSHKQPAKLFFVFREDFGGGVFKHFQPLGPRKQGGHPVP